MARLPKPGDADYNWGETLNKYLLVEHNPDGTLKQAPLIEGAEQADKKNKPLGYAGLNEAGRVQPQLLGGKGADKTTYLRGDMTWASLNSVTTGAIPDIPHFNVEDYGAVGDGTTDDYPAIRDAWDDMVAAGGGYLVFPRAVTYRIVADVSGRLVQGSASQYALFPIPQVPADSTHGKQLYGIMGVGEAYVPRMWGGSTSAVTAPTQTSSVLQVDYSSAYSWSSSYGLPSVFGARDMDIVGGYNFTNVHFVVNHLTVRQPADPSMCSFNLEACNTARIYDMACDVQGYLDNAPEPTHPTGASLLLPRTDNAVAVKVDQFFAWGMYTGFPITEHSDVASAIIVRCKIGLPIRRTSSHFAHLTSVCMEQCPWGLTGYDPSGSGSNGGIVAPASWTIVIDFLDIEDFDYSGTKPWMYVSTGPKAHVYDPNNNLRGCIRAKRVDSGTANGSWNALYVNGGSNISLYTLENPTVASTRLTGGTPSVSSPTAPDVPTIGTATAGNGSASVTFTPPSNNGGSAITGYTVTSTPGSFTGTGTSSPITVSGLTNGTVYSFTVHATNAIGSSAESASSNSVTPSTGGGGTPTTYVSDDFNRSNSSSLGTTSTSQSWSVLSGGTTWGIVSNQAQHNTSGSGGSYHKAVVDSGQADGTVTVDITIESGGALDTGFALRAADDSNFIFVDFSSNGSGGYVTRTFKCISGSFTGITTLTTVSGLSASSTFTAKAVMAGSTVTIYVDTGSGFTQVGQSTATTGLESNTKHGLVSDSGILSTFDNFLMVS